MFELKCLTCIHGEVCAYKHGGVDLSIISGDCKYYKPTADVVPKSEVDKLEYTLTGVMHSVDKWLDGEELEQDEVNRAITMREKTLRIVEQYQEKLEDYKDCWYKIHDSYNADCRESYNIGRQEVAREIFEEMQSCLIQRHWNGLDIVSFEFDAVKYAELKKKYMESEGK